MRKGYGRGEGRVLALDGVSLTFAAGTFTALMGPSGSGKSTLLHCAAGLDKPDEGRIHLGDTELTRLSESKLLDVRRRRIGVVFQSFNLVASLTAAENVALPGRLAGQRVRREAVHELLARVGLADRARHLPSRLSGGQQQRVAIARALFTRPDVVFADEPTGALDTRAGAEVLGLLRETVDTLGQTVVMVTHDPRAASTADRVVFFADGKVAGELRSPSAERIGSWLAELGA